MLRKSRGTIKGFCMTFVSLGTIFLAGCATGFKPVPVSPNSEIKKLIIVPVTPHKIGYASLSGGQIFGFAGILLEQKLAGSEGISDLLEKNISQQKLVDSFVAAATPTFNGMYKNAAIEITETSSGAGPTLYSWFKLESGITPRDSRFNEIYVEVGFQLEVNKYITGVIPNGVVGIKFIDGKTNKVIGKTIDASVASPEKIYIKSGNEEITQETFLARSQEAMSSLVSRLTISALNRAK